MLQGVAVGSAWVLDSGWQEKEESDAPGQVEGGVVDAARDRTRVQAADENERR